MSGSKSKKDTSIPLGEPPALEIVPPGQLKRKSDLNGLPIEVQTSSTTNSEVENPNQPKGAQPTVTIEKLVVCTSHRTSVFILSTIKLPNDFI